MTKSTRRQFTAMAAAGAAGLMAAPRLARAADSWTLKIHSFSGPTAPEAVNFVLPFIKACEEQSGGRLKLQFYPAMQLGGKASDLIEQMEDQVVDIVVTIPGVTPGRFSGLEGMDMPFTNVGTSAGQTGALLTFADKWLMNNEFKGIKILHMHGTDPATLHMVDKEIATLADFDGMKIRAPGRYLGEAIKALGGTPVGLSLGETYEALERHQVDGMAINWAIIPPYKLQEVTKYHLDVALYQNPIMVLMNDDSFSALPEDLQKVISDNIGLEKSVAVAKKIDAVGAAARKDITDAGGVIYPIAEGQLSVWEAKVKPIYDIWIDEMNKRGQDGKAMFADLMATTAKFGRAA